MTIVALRIVGFLVLLTIGASVAAYLFTRDRRWLRFGWQVVKYSVLVAAIAAAFLIIEQLILAA